MEGIARNKDPRDFFEEVNRVTQSVDMEKLTFVADLLWRARANKKNVFFFGNGGSHAIASHLACDLGKGIKPPHQNGYPAFRVFALDCAPWLTAQANDGEDPFVRGEYPGSYSHGYDGVFVGQMENFIEPGDVAVGISSSGNSQNILNALLFAKSREATTVAIVGFDGGEAARIADHVLLARTEKGNYGVVESAHSTWHHYLYELFKASARQEQAELR